MRVHTVGNNRRRYARRLPEACGVGQALLQCLQLRRRASAGHQSHNPRQHIRAVGGVYTRFLLGGGFAEVPYEVRFQGIVHLVR